MDETNPKDITANRATEANPAPAASGAAFSAATAIPAAVPARHVPPPPVPPPALSVPLVQPVPLPPVPSIPPPVQPVQPPIPPIQNTTVSDAGTTPVTSERPALLAETTPTPKPLREDIARIIGKIKLPERIALKMSGEQIKPPTAPPPTVPPAPEKEAGGTELSSQLGGAPAQTPHQIEDAQKGKEPPSSVASVHTLKDDLQNVVRDKKMSLVRAVALESEKKRGQEHLAGPGLPSGKARSHKIIGIAFVAVIFIALGLVAFVGVRTVLLQGAENAQLAAAPSLIFAEGAFPFPQETRTGMDMKRALIEQVRKVPSISLGAIVHIIPTSSETGADGSVKTIEESIGDFLTAIETQATPELIRSFRGDFFFGLHKTTEKLAPVLIIPVTSYERAFAGMLAWEPTLNSDLSPIFISVPPQTMNEKGLFVEREFQDTLINNYDVRVLKDDSGATQLMYSFPTRTMLIISESPYSFTEVLSRLRASRQL